MGQQHTVESLVAQGLTIPEVARQLGISAGGVIACLEGRVAEGRLRPSDIYFAFPAEMRRALQRAAMEKDAGASSVGPMLRKRGLDERALQLFVSLRHWRVFAGDMYEYIAEVELAIHRLAKDVLQDAYGVEESGWWRQGVPVETRKTCVARREDDDNPCDTPFAYTTIFDLCKILQKNWSLFQRAVPDEYSEDRKKMARDLARLNTIRNSVMHPVKERKLYEDDFQFVRAICRTFKPGVRRAKKSDAKRSAAVAGRDGQKMGGEVEMPGPKVSWYGSWPVVG